MNIGQAIVTILKARKMTQRELALVCCPSGSGGHTSACPRCALEAAMQEAYDHRDDLTWLVSRIESLGWEVTLKRKTMD